MNPPAVIVVAHQIAHALELYKAGADYVILPHFLGASHAATMLRKFTKEALDLQHVRGKHIKHLESRLLQGHEHPEVERG
jgi:hypothetical protein